MSNDLHGQMQRVAAAIGASHYQEVFKKLVARATFKGMKENAVRTAPRVRGGLYKDPGAFFNSGQGRKWKSKLHELQIAAYDAKNAKLLGVEDVRYLEAGLGQLSVLYAPA